MYQGLLASFWLPESASANAPTYDALFYFILAVNIVFSSLIMALLIWFVFRYRHRAGQPHDPSGGHSTALELTWTIIPTLLVLVIFWYGFRGYLHANVLPPNAVEITANGKMWNWSFTYPNGLVDDELHLVVNKPALMVLESSDVLHDLDIPAFRMKKDVVPGRYNKEWFEPNRINPAPVVGNTFVLASKTSPPMTTVSDGAIYDLYAGDHSGVIATADLRSGDTFGFQLQTDGTTAAVYTKSGETKTIPLDPKLAPDYSWKTGGYYQVFCAMYCGTNHSTMLARCYVQSQADFDKWMADRADWAKHQTPIQRGKDIFAKRGCATCHSVDGTRITGPTWKDLYGSQVEIEGGPNVLADDAYIEESIYKPAAKIVKGYQNVMPSFEGQLKQNDIQAVIWYMKSISSNYKGDLTLGNTIGGLSAPAGGPTTGPATVPATAPATVPATTPAAGQ